MQNWLLPEYIADILPATARQVETAKAQMLELFRCHGYELVMPPLVEYTDALMHKHDVAIARKTFKFDDYLSGKQLGLRSDITPQVARIDAHLLSDRLGVTRLCYAGSVVHSRPNSLLSSREPFQLGAELYGFAGIEADIEIIQLMLDTLDLFKIPHITLDVGHIGIWRGLVSGAGLDTESAQELLEALKVKDFASIRALTFGMSEPFRSAFLALPELYGSADILAQARRALPSLPEIDIALMQLNTIANTLSKRVNLSFDLADLRGDDYHTGLVFAVYAEGWSEALTRGGRYDNVGRRFGRARPATGFSLDLRDLIRILPERSSARGIRVAVAALPEGQEMINALRAKGEMVVVDYLGESAEALNCDRQLVSQDGGWLVVPFV